MANWIPVYYALTGSKEELLDIESKINQVEQTAREKQKAEGSDWTGCEIEHFARLIGSELTYADLGGYWDYDSNALEWKQTDDGEEYLLWSFTNKHWENPRMREMIEGAYSSVKIFYEAPAGDTNDKEERYFVPRIKMVNVNGLNYALGKDGTAMLNCDDCIKGKVLEVAEQIECNGKIFQVTSFGDAFADPQYGSGTKAPQELEEIFFPVSIKEVAGYCTSPSTLKAIHFAGNIDYIGEYAFDCCKQLATVEFAGKVNAIEYRAFGGTAIKDILIPDGTRVDPDAFEDSPFGDKKSLAISFVDVRKLPGAVDFLRQMQYRMDIRILIDGPYDSNCAVKFDECMDELSKQLRWIYENLGDELLRNTVVGNGRTIQHQVKEADIKITYYDWLNEINITVSQEGCDNLAASVHSTDELRDFLLKLDSCIEECKEE